MKVFLYVFIKGGGLQIEHLSSELFMSVISIILIDLVLGGDNAIVIGMAARNLPRNMQKQVIILGTIGAVIIRIIATVVIVWFLKIPGIQLVGGLVLLFIAYKLVRDKKKETCTEKECTGFWSAIGTIMIADAAMGIDNILAVAGAAHGSMLVVIFGLAVSIPIVVWGSTLVIKLIDRFPVIIYAGAAVIAYTAAGMIIKEPWIAQQLIGYPALNWIIVIVAVIGIILSGLITKKHSNLSD